MKQKTKTRQHQDQNQNQSDDRTNNNKTLYRKLRIDHHLPSSGAPGGKTVPFQSFHPLYLVASKNTMLMYITQTRILQF